MKPLYLSIMSQHGIKDEQEYAEEICKVCDSERTAHWILDYVQFPDNEIRAKAIEQKFNPTEEAVS